VAALFKSLSGGIARFVLAWLTPSVIALGLFCIFVLPGISDTAVFKPLTQSSSTVELAQFAFFAFTLSVVFAYASLPIYQVLEGYRLPGALQRALRARHLREFHRLRVLRERFEMTGEMPPGVDADDFLLRYPPDIESVRATRLGNALTTMEGWSRARYHLDSQTMWHELQAVSSDNVRRDVDEGRAPVDFFVSAMASMTLLTLVALPIGLFTEQRQALVIAVLALLSLPLSYRLAVENTVDWSQSVKAMVNVGRVPLASALGLAMPATLQAERAMWAAQYYAIEMNDQSEFEAYDSFRAPAPSQPSSPRWSRFLSRRSRQPVSGHGPMRFRHHVIRSR
jgi:hypothetical protein